MMAQKYIVSQTVRDYRLFDDSIFLVTCSPRIPQVTQYTIIYDMVMRLQNQPSGVFIIIGEVPVFKIVNHLFQLFVFDL